MSGWYSSPRRARLFASRLAKRSAKDFRKSDMTVLQAGQVAEGRQGAGAADGQVNHWRRIVSRAEQPAGTGRVEQLAVTEAGQLRQPVADETAAGIEAARLAERVEQAKVG